MEASIVFSCFFGCLLLFGYSQCLSISKLNTLSNNNNVGKERFHGGGWHIHVTIHVYSGRKDPTWYIPDTHPSYHVILRNMGTVPGKPLPSKLGYKGFSLVHLPPGGDVAVGGHYNQTVTSLPDWEMYLLQTADGVGDGLRKHAKQTILNSRAKRWRRSNTLYYPDYDFGSLFGNSLTTTDHLDLLNDDDMYKLAKLWGLDKRFKNITTTPTPIGPTRFEPDKWDKYFVKDHNNCYNYANNRITDTFAQPGRAGGCEMSLIVTHGAEIGKMAKCDGLLEVSVPNSNALPPHAWNLAALVFWPPAPGSEDFDFHWYRLDVNGKWSHKPGRTSATNVDQSEKPIYDPRDADRGPYTEFVCFFQTRQDKVILI